jgi:DNA-binding beta-propeller fold protein YncE
MENARRALAAAVVIAIGVLGATAATGAPSRPQGALVQARGPAGCVQEHGLQGCTRARALRDPESLAMSADGRHAYVAAFESEAVAVFTRNRATGALRQLSGSRGCLSRRRHAGCARARALAAPVDVAVSPDGRNVYVVSNGNAGLAAFARNRRTGELRQLPGHDGCVSQFASVSCLRGRALSNPIAVVVSRDGRRVYTASRGAGGGIAVFDRAPNGALSQDPGPDGCVTPGGREGCTAGRAVRTPWALDVSRDSRNVYVAAAKSNALAVFTVTPTGLAQPEGQSGCLATRGAGGCTAARGVIDPDGVAVSPDGQSVYVGAFQGDSIAIFQRQAATGALSQRAGAAGCVSLSPARERCAAARALYGVHGVAVTPDSRTVYAVAETGHAVTAFARAQDGGLRQLPGRWGCVVRLGSRGCPTARGLANAVLVTPSPDGRHVYVTPSGGERRAIGIFRRHP